MFREWKLSNVIPFSAEYKDIDVDLSENRPETTGLKLDSQLTDVSSTTMEGSRNDDKQEPTKSNNGKTICKSNNVSMDANSQKLLINSDTPSTVINRIPKSELVFRDNASSAISDTNNEISELPPAMDSDAAEIEIKQEESDQSLSTSLPSHAISKVQVCIINIILILFTRIYTQIYFSEIASREFLISYIC